MIKHVTSLHAYINVPCPFIARNHFSLLLILLGTDSGHLMDLSRFTDATADCPALIKRVKTEIESNLARTGADYSKYANFPSCSGMSLLVN